MKSVAAAGPARDAAAAAQRRVLERAGRRRADGDDAAPVAPARARSASAAAGADLVALRIDDVILDALDAHRLERAVADVQRDLGALDAASLERRQQLRA